MTHCSAPPPASHIQPSYTSVDSGGIGKVQFQAITSASSIVKLAGVKDLFPHLNCYFFRFVLVKTFAIHSVRRAILVPYHVQSGGTVHGPRRMLQKYFKSNFDPLSNGIDQN